MESGHGLTCKCGQTFKTSEQHTQHVAIEKILDEVKRIGREKFHDVAKNWENDAHRGDLREFAAAHNLELTPENATKIAKKEITHMVQHYDEIHVDDYQNTDGDNQ